MPTTEIWQRIFCYMFAFSYSYLSTYRLSTHAFAFILYPSLYFSNHHTLGLFLDYFPTVTAPIYPWYQWSPKCWHSNCLLVYRKKVLELIFHNVSTGKKRKLSVSIILGTHWQWHSYSFYMSDTHYPRVSWGKNGRGSLTLVEGTARFCSLLVPS